MKLEQIEQVIVVAETKSIRLAAENLFVSQPNLSLSIKKLEEEIGARAGRWTPMGQMLPTPGFCDELQHVYLARDLDFGENHPDADEFLEVVKLPLQEAEEMAVDGRLEDSKTVAAILRACRVLEREEHGK